MKYFVIFMLTFGGGFLFSYGISHNLAFCLIGGVLFGVGLAIATENSQRDAG